MLTTRYIVFLNDDPDDTDWSGDDFSLQQFVTIEARDAFIANTSKAFKLYTHEAEWEIDEKVIIKNIVNAFVNSPEKF